MTTNQPRTSQRPLLAVLALLMVFASCSGSDDNPSVSFEPTWDQQVPPDSLTCVRHRAIFEDGSFVGTECAEQQWVDESRVVFNRFQCESCPSDLRTGTDISEWYRSNNVSFDPSHTWVNFTDLGEWDSSSARAEYVRDLLGNRSVASQIPDASRGTVINNLDAAADAAQAADAARAANLQAAARALRAIN